MTRLPFHLKRFAAFAILAASLIPGFSDERVLRDGFAIGSMGRAGRTPFHTDALEEAIVLGKWLPPKSGDSLTRADGTNLTWNALSANDEGTFTGRELRGGYLYCPVSLENPEIRVLQASGHNMVYVNGEPRAGDPYSNGTLELPVFLRAGTNDFLFNVGRGQLKAKLVTPKSSAFFSERDHTLPDILAGQSAAELWAAVPVLNATTEPLTNLTIEITSDGATTIHAAPGIQPLTVRKVPFKIPSRSAYTNSLANYSLTLRRDRSGEPLDSIQISLRVRKPTDHYKQTFRSEIDGSVQYYAVVPPDPLPPASAASALFLSTHGAGVEAMGQADAYRSKSWGYLVAPTNRRPYGFDWEEWGRIDALEVLSLAQSKFQTDPAQTYLTGHSMGGHGTWQLGVTFPDRFAAIAPSAGWISFFSYGGGRRSENPDPIQSILQRASNPSDTLALASNYLQHAIYILHGDQDDNVPVTQARQMKERLGEFHRDFLYHEQPGAGHWWGNACVDWPPIFDMFARHKIPADSAVTHLQFATFNPGISSSNHWLVIESQEHPLARSSVDLKYSPESPRFHGSTENVARLTLRTAPFGISALIPLEIDGDKIEAEPNAAREIVLERENGHWLPARAADPGQKNPRRSGPFKEAFNHRMIFVYATGGSASENAWALSKARYDAETWLYRGNGSVDVLPDIAFHPDAEPDRSVVLYGNGVNNLAWAALLPNCPVQIGKTAVTIGQRDISGEDLACLFVRPRPGSDTACVAVIGGTGLVGLRLTERVPCFLSGVSFPDCTVFGIDSLREPRARAAGFFGNDWSVEKGDFAWRDR